MSEPFARPARAQAGRGPLLNRRLGISGAVITIMGVSAACLAVFGLALYATSLAF